MTRDAFISYARNPDEEFAPALHAGLQTLGKPWNKRRALDVFLDKAGLEASASLGDSLQRDLEGARYLVVLASPGFAGSHWCGEEVRHWLATTGAADRLLLGLTDGEIAWNNDTGDFDWDSTTALPQASMSGVFEAEPLWVDFRDVKGTEPGALDVRAHKGFEDLVATIGAPIHGLSKDALVGKDLKEFKKSQRLRRVAIGALTLLTVVAAVLAIFARQQQNEAVAQRNVAEEQRGIAEENERTAIANLRIAEAEAREAAARELAASSAAALVEDPELGVLLALESVATTADADGYILEASLQALHDAVAANGIRQRFEVFEPWPADRGHSELGSIEFDPTGTIIAASLANGTIATFERDGVGLFEPAETVDSGFLISQIRPRDDAAIIATVHNGVWNAETDEQILTDSRQVAVASDGTIIGVDGSGQIVSVGPDGEPELGPQHQLVDDSYRNNGRVTDIDVNPSDTHVAFSDDLGRLWIWERGAADFALQYPERRYNCLAVVWLTDEIVAQGCGDGLIYVYDIVADQRITIFRGHTGPVNRLDATADGRWLVSGGDDWTARVWDLTTRQQVRELAGHTAPVKDVAATPLGDLIATVSQDGAVIVWARETGEQSWKLADAYEELDHTLSFTPSGSLVTVATDDGNLALAGDLVIGDIGVDARISHAIGDDVVTGTKQGDVFIGSTFAPYSHGEEVRDISAGDDRVATVSRNSVWIWNVSTGEATQVGDDNGFAPDWTSVSLSPDGTRLAIGSWNSDVQVYDVSDAADPQQLAAMFATSVTDLAIHPTEPLVAVAITGGPVLMFDHETGGETGARLEGHRDWVLGVAFSADGEFLATGGRDKSVRMWDVPDREEVHAFHVHDAFVNAVAFDENASVIASSGSNGRVVLHNVGLTTLVELAEERLTRTLTDAECQRFLRAACPPPRDGVEVDGMVITEDRPDE